MPGPWRIALEVPEGAAEPFMAALEESGDSIAVVRAASGLVLIEAIVAEEPDRAALEVAVALAAASARMAPPAISLHLLGARDWLAENRASFPPIVVGGYAIHAPGDAAPRGKIALALDAGMAFGSGRHASTQGCLRAFTVLRRRRVRRALDLGCGSAILAVAIAKTWPASVLAVDNDGEALPVAEENARINGVRARVAVARSNGLAARRVGAGAPYDLIAANILLGPLVRFAPAIRNHLAPGGIAVMSGLLQDELPTILRACRRAGLAPVRRFRTDGWAALILRRA